jgi:hypothetical protein
MLTLEHQQLANCLAAVKQEKLNIAELQANLATATCPTVKQVLKHRIKICKDFQRKFMLTAQSLEYSINNKVVA